jgi:hypothetical protein
VQKPEARRPLGTPRRGWEVNVKVDFKEIGWDGMEWINLAWDGDKW